MDDAATVPGLLNQVEGKIESFTADTAYDARAVHAAAKTRGSMVAIPPTKAAQVRGDGLQHGAAELGDTLGVTESGANRRNPRAPMRPAGRWNLVASQRQTPLSGGVTRDDAALCEVGEGIGVAW